MSITLHGYFRSSAAYRVRIALNLKNVPYELVAVHLTKDGGQHTKPAYAALNPIQSGSFRRSKTVIGS